MRADRGFSFIETLTVIGLILLLAATGAIATFALLGWQSLLNNTNLVTSQIALAQMESYTQVDDQSHGVNISSQTVTRFTGDSYALRQVEKDVSFQMPANITVTGDTQIVFPVGDLSPSQPVLVSLQLGDRVYDISISSYGVLQVTAGSPGP
ncbi:MAG: hypothetical protein AAB413_03960 [Patescibacteria group bacterium]